VVCTPVGGWYRYSIGPPAFFAIFWLGLLFVLHFLLFVWTCCCLEIDKRGAHEAKLAPDAGPSHPALGCWPKPSSTRMLGRTSQHSDAGPDQPAPDAG
jgi:hypothetical protein